MTRLTWGDAGSRIYEAGIDRGVLYVGAANGVPWNGLISVTESQTGGEADPLYMDGEKYRNDAKPTEFAATIEAFSYPESFGQCDGLGTLATGLYIDNQPRVPFGLSYRTKIGNDLKGADFGYKLHIVYNALASPPARSYKSEANTPSPLIFSWPITTTPVRVAGRKSSAHFVVDSTKTPPAKLTTVENYLYGTSGSAPRIPTVTYLMTMLQ